MDDSLNGWFVREILVHEAALVRYLHRAWGNRDEVSDLRPMKPAAVSFECSPPLGALHFR